jgi:hypothetical protein
VTVTKRSPLARPNQEKSLKKRRSNALNIKQLQLMVNQGKRYGAPGLHLLQVSQ